MNAKLKQIAARETKTLINRLPAELRAKLSAVAVVLQSRPNKDQIADNIESDCLGLFTGPSLRDGDEGAILPPQIILFLENIFDEAQDSGRGYRAELRRTFLHELGHYLGLEEDDLVVRDVD
jgi:predicted Zn-dependent protease with MMP-like domain